MIHSSVVDAEEIKILLQIKQALGTPTDAAAKS